MSRSNGDGLGRGWWIAALVLAAVLVAGILVSTPRQYQAVVGVVAEVGRLADLDAVLWPEGDEGGRRLLAMALRSEQALSRAREELISSAEFAGGEASDRLEASSVRIVETEQVIYAIARGPRTDELIALADGVARAGLALFEERWRSAARAKGQELEPQIARLEGEVATLREALLPKYADLVESLNAELAELRRDGAAADARRPAEIALEAAVLRHRELRDGVVLSSNPLAPSVVGEPAVLLSEVASDRQRLLELLAVRIPAWRVETSLATSPAPVPRRVFVPILLAIAGPFVLAAAARLLLALA